jgi:hypothetical protein
MHARIAENRKLIHDLVLTGLLFFLLFLFLVFPILLVAAWATVIWEAIAQRNLLARQLTRGNFAPAQGADGDAQYRRTLIDLAAAQEGNVVVYSGYAPFVGAGFDVGGWSFAINVDKPKEEVGQARNPAAFEIQELYDDLSRRISSLGIESLTLDDRLYVNGKEIRYDTTFLPNPLERPVSKVRDDVVALFVDHPTESVRHYKRIVTTSWNGELVLSIFLRFTRTGKSLFAEASYFLLTPLKPSHHLVDSLGPVQSPRQYLEVAGQTLLPTFVHWIVAPFHVYDLFLRSLRRWQQEKATRRLIMENPAFDYGAKDSVREAGAALGYTQYFQRLDEQMYLKVVERNLLDAIIDFLDVRNIDTSDLRERQTTILNSGVIVSGGSVQANNLAVGAGSRIAGLARMAGVSPAPAASGSAGVPGGRAPG